MTQLKKASQIEHDHKHGSGGGSWLATWWRPIASAILLGIGIVLDKSYPDAFTGWIRLALYLAAYAPVGLPVLKRAIQTASLGDVFTEFTLMSIATIGAFAIREYPEGVAVMLFYATGELIQDAAVERAQSNIKALLDVRPATATVLRNGKPEVVDPKTVNLGETIAVKPGEKVPLDATLNSEKGSFNTAALTGESKPTTVLKGAPVLAGSISIDQAVELTTTKGYDDSALSKIIDMVQHATTKKAKTEQFIRRFARVYTPIVTGLAVLLVLIPYFFVAQYDFQDWLYRGLVFLVISCPCALVISIPLGYFGGIGAASRQGILFKGSTYLDAVRNTKTVVMDKTGTLTEGVFSVQDVQELGGDADWLRLAGGVESHSTHPAAQTIVQYAKDKKLELGKAEVEEIAGHGLRGQIEGKNVLVGNERLMTKNEVSLPKQEESPYTIIWVAVDGKPAGRVLISDKIKEDAKQAVEDLKKAGVQKIVMLSGDKQAVVNDVAGKLGIEAFFGDLLPEGKVEKVEALKAEGGTLVFVGDGINDAPVLALSDVGMAMGGLGSDAAIETADVVIQTDKPSKIATAIQIGRSTHRVIIQNISLAFAVKGVVLVLGAGGLANMWEAVFADVGVAMLAILNASRLGRIGS